MSDINVTVNDEIVNVDVIDETVIVNVVNSPGVGVPSGGVTGQVLKKLSNSDYDTYWAIDGGGVPYLGATGDVDLGEHELKAGQLELDQTPTGTAGVAVTRWNDSVGTTETTLKGGHVVLKHGRDMFERVVNKTGIQLTKAAYQAVRISTAQGQRLGVELAQANNDTNSADTIGLVVETIDNNQEGIIYTVGEVIGINTTGSLQGETWVDGDVLYLSPTTAGRITNVKPVAPQHLVIIGYVVYAHANNGKIYVKTTNGFELGELHDVNTNGATNGQVLKYNGTIWTPSTDAGITGSGVSGQVAYWNGTNTQTGSGAFVFNDLNNRLGIGGAASNALTVTAQTVGDGLVLKGHTGLNIFQVTRDGSSGNTAELYQWSGGNIRLAIRSTSNLSYFNGGNFAFGSNVDSGQVLQVNGTSLFTGASTFNSTITASSFIRSGGLSTQYLMADGSTSTLTNPITGTGVSGQVAYWSGTNTQTGSNNLFWDATNNRLGIGTNAPASSMHIQSNLTGANPVLVLANGQAQSGTTGSLTYFNSGANTVGSLTLTSIRHYIAVQGTIGAGTSVSTQSGFVAHNSLIGAGQNYGFYGLIPSGGGRWNLFMEGTANNHMAGNLLLGTTTDSGQRLQVTGDTLLRGSGNTSATTALTVQNSDGTNMYRFLNNGEFLVGSSGAVNIRPGDGVGGGTVISGFGLQLNFGFSNTAGYGLVTRSINSAERTNTSGEAGILDMFHGFAPTSGTGTFMMLKLRGTINQTGGANGITRGLYVNPTLTAAADWRSIEWSNNSGWGLYGAGTALNYLGGRLAIGSTNFGSSVLAVRANLTGGTSQAGVLQSGTVLSDVTNTVRGFLNQFNTQAAAFSLFEYYHFDATQGTIGASSSVSNQYGFRASDSLTGATNNYGFYGNIPSGSGRWNLYMNGTANNYLNGGLAIGGSTDLTAHNIRLIRSVGGATSAFGFSNATTFNSDVTLTGHGFQSFLSTQAAAFTLNFLYHYRAQLSGLGAGSSVGTQVGFIADSTIVGATNNYGFQGVIAAGTGRWNAYMSGTAANYFNGNTIMGTLAADSGEKLQVNGTMKVTGASTFGGNMSLALSQNATTKITVTNADLGVNTKSEFVAVSRNSGTTYFGRYSILTTAYKIINASDGYVLNETLGDFAILNDVATGSIKMAAGGSSTAQWTIGSNGDLTAADGENIIFGTTNGTKLGTATSQKIGFWNATPIVQPTTSIAEATFVENSGGTAVNVDSTFAGYTLQQIAQALKNMGILA